MPPRPPPPQPLPPPGQLVCENVLLLAGSDAAFRERYGLSLTPATFAKSGATASAAAVLHFLLCVIDGDTAHALFKPCFPSLDREQERDFRRVVDTRLAALEKNKLLPAGAARKSVVAAAGGDRFVDLLWSLSNLAVQQACLRHQPYGSVSRLRLMSHHVRTESTLSHQSSARSVRSVLSTSSRPDRPDPVRQQRRFLGVGMLTASQQRAKDAEDMRARIDAERTALARTTEMAKNGAKTWASEADSLREKIGEFEAKVRRLKGQLADMGFDENGNDIRNKADTNIDQPRIGLEAGIPQSSSGEDLGEELKTSPIESMESGSSVDELPEPVDGCEDIAADLSRLLSFAKDTQELRDEVDSTLAVERPTAIIQVEANVEKEVDTGKAELETAPKPQDIVDLVRAAADELEQATNRMDEIEQERRKAEELESPIDSSEDCSFVHAGDNRKNDCSVTSQVNSALEQHKEVVESSRRLQKEAIKLTERSQDNMKSLLQSESDDSLRNDDDNDDLVAAISKPTWLEEATADASTDTLTEKKTTQSNAPTSPEIVDTAKDVELLTHALQAQTSRKHSRSSNYSSGASSSGSLASSRQRKEKSRPGASRHARSRSSASTSRDGLDVGLASPASSSASKTSRSVRFAALPPSYSGRRAVGPHPSVVHHRMVGSNAKVFPKSPQGRNSDEDDELSGEEVALSADPKSCQRVQFDEGGKSGDQGRLLEKNPALRPEALSAPRPPAHRRLRSADERLESSRVAIAAPGIPSKMQRTQTPRRLARSKEALLRATAVKPPTGNAPKSASVICRSEADSPRKGEDIKNEMPGTQVEDVSVSMSSGEEVGRSSDGLAMSDSVERASDGDHLVSDRPSDMDNHSVAADSVSVTTEIATLQMDTARKRLFATPEPTGVSSSNRRAPSSHHGASNVTENRTPTMTQDVPKSPGTVAPQATTKDHGRVPIPSSSTGNSILLSSGDDDELLFTPTGNTSSVSRFAGGSSGPKVSNGTGFFAGETAQWQQNVRSRSTVGGSGVIEADQLPSVDTAPSFSKNGNRASTSARKSRVRSLKARLAAVLK